MSDTDVTVGTSVEVPTPEIKDGKMNAFGMDISIADIIGGKIVDQWFSRLTEDDMNLIFKAVEQEIFDHNYQDEKFFKTTREVKSSWGYSSSNEDTPIWKTTKDKFAKKYNEIILSKVDEILASETYQNRANEIAKEIVDYATEGYKTDMINRVRERLVGNVLDASPSYAGINIHQIVADTVHSMFPNNGY